MQCAAHCARLTLLEIMQELLKRQMPAASQENPNTFCERFHHYFVILGPSIRIQANYVNFARVMFEKLR